MSDTGALNFWRLFHCLLSHNTTEEESIRTKATWAWFGDHLTTLRKIASLSSIGDRGEGLELLGLVWSLTRTIDDLPGINIVREKALQLDERSDAVSMLLDNYKEFLPSLSIHPAKDLDAVLQDCCKDWEMAAVTNMLQRANRICNSSADNGKGKPKLSGPSDTVKFLHQRMEEGLLIKPNQTLRPINVNKEAPTIGEWYDESLNTKFLPTLSDHFKSGQRLSLQNRPTEVAVRD
jgi:hypothetical protein